jgi:hypothetical protein
MFRGFLDHNTFVKLLRTAIEDGFNATVKEQNDYDKQHSARTDAGRFARVAQACAPEALRTATRDVHVSNEDDGVIMGEPKTETVTINLSEIVSRAWLSGFSLKERSEDRSEPESYEQWKERLNSPEKMQAIIAKNVETMAQKLADEYPELVDRGSYPRQWKLMVDENVSVGTYCGPELKAGDYVEYAVGYPAKVLKVEGDRASVVRAHPTTTTTFSPRRTPGQVENLTNRPSGPMITLEESLRRVMSQPKKVSTTNEARQAKAAKMIADKTAETVEVEIPEEMVEKQLVGMGAKKTKKSRKRKK